MRVATRVSFSSQNSKLECLKMSAAVVKSSLLDDLLSDDDELSIHTAVNAESSPSAGNEGNDGGAGGAEGEEPEELKLDDNDAADPLKTKKRVQKRKFDENTLTSDDGLDRVYKEFPQSWKNRGKRGRERQDLERLIILYKEWAFQLYPGKSINDIVKETRKLGSKRAVKDAVLRMRETEKERYMRDALGYKPPVASPEEHAMTSPEATSSRGDPDSASRAGDNGDASFDSDADDAMMALLDSADMIEAAPVTATRHASASSKDSMSGMDTNAEAALAPVVEDQLFEYAFPPDLPRPAETISAKKSHRRVIDDDDDDNDDDDDDNNNSEEEGEVAMTEKDSADSSALPLASMEPTQIDMVETHDDSIGPTQIDATQPQ